jgi:hypothetical protein
MLNQRVAAHLLGKASYRVWIVLNEDIFGEWVMDPKLISGTTAGFQQVII